MANPRSGAPLGARLVATLVDIACMLPWIGVVAAAGAVLWTTGVTRSVDDVTGNMLGFITLIVPITIAAAGYDGRPRHATPGKRLLRLRITVAVAGADADDGDGDGDGDGPSFSRALIRNAIKYALPWEFAHTAVFALVDSTGAPSTWVVVVLVTAYAIPLVSLVLLLATGRPLHDRVAHTAVLAAAA